MAIDKIFAENGDKTEIPVISQEDGSISIEEGFSSKYATNPADGGLYVTRTQWNSILNHIYTSIKELQDKVGIVSSVTDIAHGGTGATTAENARLNLGLGNVDNTSDQDKPISSAVQNALNNKQPLGSYATTLELNNGLAGKASADHTHTDKADVGHKHGASDITSGTFPIAKIDGLQTALDSKQASGSYAASNHNHDTVYQAKGNYLTSLPSHNHDDRYFTETEINTKLGGYSTASHNHDSVYQAKGSYAASNHNHSGVYQPVGNYLTSITAHKHGGGDITSAVANATNADTVDGLHAYEMQTLSAGGQSHGLGWKLICQHSLDGDGYFKFRAGDGSLGVKVDNSNLWNGKTMVIESSSHNSAYGNGYICFVK